MRVKKTAQAILDLLDRQESELSLALVGDREIQELNARYRNKNEPTDVLSFPFDASVPAGNRMLGDVVISVDRAERQARMRGKRLETEIERLLIHGILHLLGYDHERSESEAKAMRALERKLSRALCGRGLLRV